jgi:hypothetical protein
MFLTSIILFVCCTSNGGSETIVLPDGWKKPTDKIFQAKWRSKDTHKYLAVGGDFNCDGLVDSAFILQPITGSGIGIFVFTQEKTGSYEINLLYDSRTDKANIDNLTEEQKSQVQARYRSMYGIQIANQGLYQTACGKEYYDCAKGEPKEILLKCVGIDFFLYDAGGNRFFYWDNLQKIFLFQWMSD